MVLETQTKKEENTISSQKKTGRIAFIITTLILLTSSGYLYFDNLSIAKENSEKSLRIDSLRNIQITLDKELQSIREELKLHKGKNEELEKSLAVANEELSAKEIKIKRLLSENSSIKRLQAELKELRSLKDYHLKRIKELEDQIAELSQENQSLKSGINDLKQQLAVLQEKNGTLEKKVQIASIIKTDNIIIIGEKKHKGGKYAPTKLKKAERLLITFDLDENKVADAGEKTFYIRVINPSQKLIENSNSGSFINADNNISMPYTSMHLVKYDNKRQKVVLPVELNGNDHPKGSYSIEFYCNGYLCGTKKLNIK